MRRHHDPADRDLLRRAAQDLRAGLRRPGGAVRRADHARDDRPARPAHDRHPVHRPPDPELTPTSRDDAANILAAHEEIRGTIELQDHRRRRRQGRCRHAGRRARPQGAAGARHHGPSHQDADHQHRRSAAEGHRRGPEEPVHARAAVEGRAGEHRRRAAHQGPAGGAVARRLGRGRSST